MRHLQLGQVEVFHLPGGYFRLDGGTMFGVVPKTMWECHAPCDQLNRVRLSCNCLLVRSPSEVALIDTGYGQRLDEREREIYGIEDQPTLLDSLRQVGLSPDDIDLVIFTHLHFDHFAGSLTLEDNALRATFHRATHCVQRGEWRDALDGHSSMKSSYKPQDLRALKEQIELKLLYGDTELSPYISTFITGGHTEWHQGIVITGNHQRMVYPGELIPTRTHLRTYWNMAYDMFPMQTIERKNQFISDALRNNWIVAWNHDPDAPWSRLQKREDRITTIDI